MKDMLLIVDWNYHKIDNLKLFDYLKIFENNL